MKFKEKCMEIVFLMTACVSILAVALICFFLFVNGLPAMKEIGFFNFLGGMTWAPSQDLYGIFPMIIGSIYATVGAIIIGVPIGLLVAVFMAFYCPKSLYTIVKPMTELLAGIPSVVYGLFGLVVIVPMIRDNFEGDGLSLLAVSILLGIMILPTVIGLSETAMRAVPEQYYQGALALGATHERSIFLTVMPAAKSGIMAGIVLGIGRAIGETMAIILVAGSQPWIPDSIFKGLRTLTINVAMEMGYAEGLHRDALVATGVVLFVFVLIINVSFSLIKEKGDK